MTGKEIVEGKSSRFCSAFLVPLYGRLKGRGSRSILRSLILRKESGPVYSRSIREVYKRFHEVDVGLYTIGPCDVAPGNLAPGTSVGRYSSIYYTVRTLSQDEPVSQEANQPLFCDSVLDRAVSRKTRTVIGHDVFIGHAAVILPPVEHIGDGAVIGAGSVVHSNIPPYAVVTGNPARVVRYRFSPEKIAELLQSKWWEKSINEISSRLADFQKPVI